jgi:hypothetical protein
VIDTHQRLGPTVSISARQGVERILDLGQRRRLRGTEPGAKLLCCQPVIRIPQEHQNLDLQRVGDADALPLQIDQKADDLL